MVMSSKLMQIEQKLEGFFNYSIISIGTLIISSLILRLYFFPYDIPLTLDAQVYFWYASDTSILGRLPDGYSFANNGWPVFVAPFFTLFKFNNMIMYMELQRIIAVSISVLTVIPVYFLCKKFVTNYIAVFGAAIFAFEPRLIQNSLLGLNDALYILIGTTAVTLFLKSDIKYRGISFALIGFTSLIRSEGLFLFFALSIMYFAQHRKSRNELLRFGILLVIFMITILPMAELRLAINGTDALTGRIINEAYNAHTSSENIGFTTYIANTITTFFGFLGRVMIPIFIFFVPVGAILILKNKNFEKKIIVVILIIMSIPALYAYSVPALDTKYLYFMFPMFCILSVLAMDQYCKAIKKPHILALILIIGILFAAIIFLVIKMPDREQELEYYQVSQYLVKNNMVVNDYYPESRYISAAELAAVWPSLKSSVDSNVMIIPISDHNKLDKYILDSKEKGLAYIVTDDKNERPKFLSDVFYHAEKYPYLIKVFDSKEQGFKYNIKIFRIDFEKFESTLH